ncbi:hypothetical protein B0H14DRAFT_3445574 [Mycena olivaceomarginata]|nr:hypothetical protein B0H14DRAFT_3445574 [Mycena olivaceomarginata]
MPHDVPWPPKPPATRMALQETWEVVQKGYSQPSPTSYLSCTLLLAHCQRQATHLIFARSSVSHLSHLRQQGPSSPDLVSYIQASSIRITVLTSIALWKTGPERSHHIQIAVRTTETDCLDHRPNDIGVLVYHNYCGDEDCVPWKTIRPSVADDVERWYMTRSGFLTRHIDSLINNMRHNCPVYYLKSLQDVPKPLSECPGFQHLYELHSDGRMILTGTIYFAVAQDPNEINYSATTLQRRGRRSGYVVSAPRRSGFCVRCPGGDARCPAAARCRLWNSPRPDLPTSAARIMPPPAFTSEVFPQSRPMCNAPLPPWGTGTTSGDARGTDHGAGRGAGRGRGRGGNHGRGRGGKRGSAKGGGGTVVDRESGTADDGDGDRDRDDDRDIGMGAGEPAAAPRMVPPGDALHETVSRERLREIRVWEKKRDDAEQRAARNRDHGIHYFPSPPPGHERLRGEPAALGARPLELQEEPVALGPRNRRPPTGYQAPPAKRTMDQIRKDAAAKKEAKLAATTAKKRSRPDSENQEPVVTKKPRIGTGCTRRLGTRSAGRKWIITLATDTLLVGKTYEQHVGREGSEGLTVRRVTAVAPRPAIQVTLLDY